MHQRQASPSSLDASKVATHTRAHTRTKTERDLTDMIIYVYTFISIHLSLYLTDMIEQAHDMIEATTNVWIRTIVHLTDMSMDT